MRGGPLDTGLFAVTVILMVITLAQFLIITSYLFRGIRPHKLPGNILFLGVLFALISYILYVVVLAGSFAAPSWAVRHPNRLNNLTAGKLPCILWKQILIYFKS